MRATRQYHSATMLANGEVLIAAGSHWETGDRLSSTELYGPTANQDLGTWTPTGSMSVPRAWHTATLLPSGRVLVVDGLSAEIYAPTTGTWTPTGSMFLAVPSRQLCCSMGRCWSWGDSNGPR